MILFIHCYSKVYIAWYRLFLLYWGNDSMDTVVNYHPICQKISDIRFIGVPKTIDNDLVHTDHTPGFEVLQNMLLPWSAKLLLMVFMTTKKICHYCRNYGASRRLALPPVPLPANMMVITHALFICRKLHLTRKHFLKKYRKCWETTPNLVVCISEGIHDKNGTLSANLPVILKLIPLVIKC